MGIILLSQLTFSCSWFSVTCDKASWPWPIHSLLSMDLIINVFIMKTTVKETNLRVLKNVPKRIARLNCHRLRCGRIHSTFYLCSNEVIKDFFF